MFVAIRLIIQMVTNSTQLITVLVVNGSIWHFKFPKVVQAHTLGEVGILGTVLLRISSGTILQFLLKSVHIWQTESNK